MRKPIFVLFVTLLLFTLPGCLVRYGEDRLNHLLSSINELKIECVKDNEKLTEDQIKEKLGKPGWFKPIYENNLDISLLDKLKSDSGISLQPNPQDLYDVMLKDIENGRLKSVKLLSYVYDRMGFEDPSLTFYIGSLEGTVEKEPKVFGWDYVEYGNKNRCNFNGEKKAFINYKIDSPADYLKLPYTFLIDTVIGLKQFVGEVIKSPISFLEAELFENIFIERKIPFYKFKGFLAAAEDWRNGVTALTYRYRVDGNQGILATTQNLLGEVPLIGSVFDQWSRKESGTANKLFLTRGIYGGDDSAQNMALWVRYFTNPPEKFTQYEMVNHPSSPPSRPAKPFGRAQGGDKGEVITSKIIPLAFEPSQPERQNQTDGKEEDCFHVKAIPYRYGSGTDVFWALLNFSHGYAYEMASEIISKCDVHPGDSVLLGGHSGGIQRNIATARILNDDGIKVEKMHGIAGPALGYAPCNKIKVVLNSKFTQGVVSDISRFLRYITLDLLTLNIDWDYDDREVRHKKDEFYYHRTPGFYDGKTRLKYDGFLCDNFEYLFK